MTIDTLGPASDNAVTVRPARTIVRGDTPTWFQDCSGPDASDGTAIVADFLNDLLAQLRTAFSSSGIVQNNNDDMLWRAMQSIGIRYAADTGDAGDIVVALTPVVASLYAGLPLMIKLAADIPGATTVTIDDFDPVDLKWPNGTALAPNDAKAGAILFVAFDGTKFQLLSKTSPDAGAASAFVPGCIYHWPKEEAPTGTLVCDGAAVSRSTYSRLFGIIGTDYGPGNNSTTFNVPDYRGEFLRGWANGSANDPDRAARTNRGDTTTGDHVGTKQGSKVGPIAMSGGSITIGFPKAKSAHGIEYPLGYVLDGGHEDALGFGLKVYGGAPNPTTGEASAIPFSQMTGSLSITGNGGSTETRPRNTNVLIVIAY